MDIARRSTKVEDAVGKALDWRAYQACGATHLSTDCAKVYVEPAMPTRGDTLDDEFAAVAESGATEIEISFWPPVPQHARLPESREHVSERC